MGEVIALPSRKIASRVPASGSAEILFFTGVRYYRLSDEEFAKLAQPRARRAAKPKSVVSAAQKPASAPRKLKRLG